MKLDHIGIAVKSIAESRGFYETGLGLKAEPEIEEVAGEKVRVLKLTVPPGSHIELLEPMSEESTIAKYIAKRGEGLHHLCYAVEDVVEATKRMKESGYTPIWDEPHNGAGGCLVNFFHPRETHGVLTELSQPPN
ncbi:MAG: methylmalonyl-CoA epimerase [Planctomycetes bacterium]|nr:methylmalonyl-CoA epimerase [Planctomycetota bacterium]